MANTTSAKKAFRSSLRKQVFNTLRKNKVKVAVKEFRRSLASSIEDSQKALAFAFSSLDKAAKHNTLPRGRANRKKSRLTFMFKKAFNQLDPAKPVVVAQEVTKKRSRKVVVKK